MRRSAPYRVHLQYRTAWVDDEGVMPFRDDLYDRDVKVRLALEVPSALL